MQQARILAEKKLNFQRERNNNRIKLESLRGSKALTSQKLKEDRENNCPQQLLSNKQLFDNHEGMMQKLSQLDGMVEWYRE